MVLLSGGHSRRVIKQGVFFAAGAGAVGSGAYTAIGATGGVVPLTSLALGTIVLAAGCVWALVWYAHPVPRLLPSPTKQLNRRYVEVPLAGAALFGAVLGVGLLTPVTTPLVWAGAIAVLASGSAAAGALYGFGFALGRTFQLLQQRMYRPCSGGEIARRVVQRARRQHAVGAAVALCLIGLAASSHM
jgi:hypothetical protein